MPRFQRFIFARNSWCWIRATALLFAVALIAGTGWTADKPSTGQPENEPIQIVADELIAYNDDNYAEFIGNVKVTQGSFTITSDKLRVHYQGDLLDTEKESREEEMLKKIIAMGNVKISSEQYNAEADQVEYDTTSKIVVLSGDDAKVISGKNSITGSVITLNQKSGQVKVEGSGNKRIKAEFFTKDKTSDAFKIDKPED